MSIEDYISSLPTPESGFGYINKNDEVMYFEKMFYGYRTYKVESNLNTTIDIETEDYPYMKIGNKIKSRKIKPIDITVYFNIIRDSINTCYKTLDEIKALLYSCNPDELNIIKDKMKFVIKNEYAGDEKSPWVNPVYRVGTCSNIQVSKINEGSNDFRILTGSFVMTCTDPRKYSVETKQYQPNPSGQITIFNFGNSPCDVDFIINNNGRTSNSFIGLTLMNPAGKNKNICIGNDRLISGAYKGKDIAYPLDLTTYMNDANAYIVGKDPMWPKQPTDSIAYSYAKDAAQKFTTIGYQQGETVKNELGQVVRNRTRSGIKYSGMTPTDSTQNRRYRGFRYRIPITLESSEDPNFGSEFRISLQPYFAASDPIQTGAITVCVNDTNGLPICGFSIAKRTAQSYKGVFHAYYGVSDTTDECDLMTLTSNVKQFDIDCQEYGSASQSFAYKRNSLVEIVKIGGQAPGVMVNMNSPDPIDDQFTNTNSIKNTRLANAKIGSIDIGMYSGFQNYNGVMGQTGRMKYMYLNSQTDEPYIYKSIYKITDRKALNEDGTLFLKNDIIKIDGTKKIPYKNNIPIVDLEILGTEYFQIPPGGGTVVASFSSWVKEKPNCTAIIRECWI